MEKRNCSHPNCRLTATRPHPKLKDDKSLCDIHYTEILDVIRNLQNILVTLTIPNDK